MIEDMLRKGRDARQIIQGWMSHYRNLLLVKFLDDPSGTVSMSMENVGRMGVQAEHLEIGAITGAIRELSQTLYDARRSTQPRVLLEMVLVKLAAGDGFDEEMRRVTYHPRNFENMQQQAPAIDPRLHGEAAVQQPAAPVYEQPAAPVYEQPAAPVYEQPAVPVYEQPVAPQPDPYALDLPAIWDAFLDKGERQIGAQFFFIRGRAVPESLEDSVLRVRVRGAARQYMEENRNALSALLSQVVGKMTLLLPVGEDEAPAVAAPDREQPQNTPEAAWAAPEEPVREAPAQEEPDQAELLRSQASDILGLDIKLEP
jgi:DNA polymerase III gamma/tau subunit